MDARGPCVSCGTPLLGSYCHACGERDPQERDHSVRVFLREHLAALTDARARGPRSFALLLGRPGRLTREYMEGRRVSFLHPLQLFLLANLLFFLMLPISGVSGLSSPLRSQLYQQAYSELARDRVRDRFLDMDSVAFRSFEARFDLATEVQARSLVILLVPLFAAALFLTRFWRREPAVQHLVFGTHFMAWALLLFIAVGLLIRASALLPPSWQQRVVTEQAVTGTAAALAAAYLYAALRRAYGDARVTAAARALGLGLVLMALLVLYRLILFFTVLYSV